MSEQLDSIIAQGGTIANPTAIKNIIDDFLSLKLSQIASQNDKSLYNYVLNQICLGFELEKEKAEQELTVEYLIYLLHLARKYDFFKFVKQNKKEDYISFPILLSFFFTKFLTSEAKNIPAISALLSININRYFCHFDDVFSNKRAMHQERIRVQQGFKYVLDSSTKSDSTVGHILNELIQKCSKPYMLGAELPGSYISSITNSYTLINDILYEYPYWALDLSQKYNELWESTTFPIIKNFFA